MRLMEKVYVVDVDCVGELSDDDKGDDDDDDDDDDGVDVDVDVDVEKVV